jgi:GH15 family glucan-1,4-alpha-glucosidase
MTDHRAEHTSTPLEDYALLSDLRTGPLVSRDGSIDWLCFPRFDSPSVFAALLGTPEDGRWRLSAVGGEVTARRYLPRTFVLETTWRTPTGTVVITDFLPPSDGRADLVRRVECVSGTVEVEHDLRIRFDYNRSKPWTRRVDMDEPATCGLLSVAGPDALLLAGPLLHPHEPQEAQPQQGIEARHEASPEGHPDDYQGAVADRLTGVFPLVAGESVDWVLTWHESHRYLPEPVEAADALERTVKYWHEWSSRVEVHERHDDLVLRSLLVLRALTHQGTGGIVAAATTSLPEEFGGSRNWDYRYTWLTSRERSC